MVELKQVFSSSKLPKVKMMKLRPCVASLIELKP